MPTNLPHRNADSTQKRTTEPKQHMAFQKTSLAVATIVLACANTGNQSAPAAASNDPLPLAEAVDFCVRLHEQMALCATEFTDLNIELRKKYFADFAELALDPNTLLAMREEGKKEVIADGSGPLEPRRERCKGYAEHGPPTPRGFVAQAEACYPKATCGEKIDCVRPFMDERYKERAQSTQSK